MPVLDFSLDAVLTLDTLVQIVLVLVLAVVSRVLLTLVIRRAVTYAVEHTKRRQSADGSSALGRIERASGLLSPRQVQRTQTLGSMLSSVSTFVIIVVALLTIMQILGLPMGPLIASAGVGGVAIGFGAQSLVKDFLSGIFMIAEDQFGVGDQVEFGDTVSGTVEEVGLRVTRLRDAGGKIIYMRNGEVLRVANLSQGTAPEDVPVAGPVTPA